VSESRGVWRSLGGVGVGFLAALGVGVGMFCPTPKVLDYFYITLLS